MIDLLGNHKLRALAVSSAKRSSLLPDLSTIEEQGVANFDIGLRYGLAAPAGTPRAIIQQLNKALTVALAADEVKKRLSTDGVDTLPSTPEEYSADIDRDEKRWGGLVRSLGLKAQ